MAERAVLAYGIIAAAGGPLQILVRYLHNEVRNEFWTGLLFLLCCAAMVAAVKLQKKIPPFAHVLGTLSLIYAVSAQANLTQYQVEPLGPVAVSIIILGVPLVLPIRVVDELLTIGSYVVYLLWLVHMRPVYLEDPHFTRLLATLFPILSIVGILATRHLEDLRMREHRHHCEIERQKELAEQQKINAEALARDLETYAHAVAHNLKNPITVITGYNELLNLERDKLSEESQEFLTAIAKGCQKMRQIINELLLLASVRKGGEVATEPLDMAKIVADACQRFSNKIAESDAEVITPEDWPQAIGHPPWVEEVWANYISNAIKYGGSPPQIELGADQDGVTQVRFWVRDNGRGLTGEQTRRLFEEFSRVEPSKAEGHGLGLSIVKQIVDKLGGEVWVTSTVGTGATFGFTLPAQLIQGTQLGQQEGDTSGGKKGGGLPEPVRDRQAMIGRETTQSATPNTPGAQPECYQTLARPMESRPGRRSGLPAFHP